MDAVAIATHPASNSSNSSSSSSSSSGYGSAAATPLGHFEAAQHAAVIKGPLSGSATPPPTAAPQTVATVAPYVYSSESILAASAGGEGQQQQQHFAYAAPYGYQTAPATPPAAALQQQQPKQPQQSLEACGGLSYVPHAAAYDYNAASDMTMKPRIQQGSSNSGKHPPVVTHSPIEKLTAYANLAAIPSQHVASNVYKHLNAADSAAPPVKPQAAATPFYAASLASGAAYYDQYKFKMPTTAAASDFANYGCRQAQNASASGFPQQPQPYFAAAKTQLPEAAFGLASKPPAPAPAAAPTPAARQQMNSFYGRANFYYDRYEKYSYPAPSAPTAPLPPANANSSNALTYPDSYSAVPGQHYAADTPRRSTVAPLPPASAWHWNVDYAAAAAGNCYSLPPASANVPPAAASPSHSSSYFPPAAAPSATRDTYFCSSSMSNKYDKYNAYAYHSHHPQQQAPQQQQQQMQTQPQTQSIQQRNLWTPAAAHASVNELLPHSTQSNLPAHQSPPSAYTPPHHYSVTQPRQNCCSQLAYQQQQQPQHNCYYTRMPSVAGGAAFAQHQVHQQLQLQQQLSPQHYSSSKYGGNLLEYAQSKQKFSSDVMVGAPSPYDAATYSGYNYAAGTQRYQAAAPQQHSSVVNDAAAAAAAAAAAYYHDLNLQSNAYESYASTMQQQYRPAETHDAARAQHVSYQQPAARQHAKNPLLDYRKPSAAAAPAAVLAPAAADTNFYLNEAVGDAASYRDFDGSETLYEAAGGNMGVGSVDKLNAVSKNLSLRDFLASWNEDEDDAAAQDISFIQPTEAAEAATALDAPVDALPAKAVGLSPCTHFPDASSLQMQRQNCDDVAPPAAENQLQLDSAQQARSKLHPGSTVDSNLPDIVIDIEKATVATPSLETFDVEKELDELQVKRVRLDTGPSEISAKAAAEQLLDAKETLLLQENTFKGLLQQHSRQDAEGASSLFAAGAADDHAAAAPDARPEAKAEIYSATEQLLKDIDCDNTSLSNESTFEKEYETFINKIGVDVDGGSDAAVVGAASGEAEAAAAAAETDEQHQLFSKFYKRKRQLIENVAASDAPHSVQRRRMASSELSPEQEESFSLVHTRRCRARKSPATASADEDQRPMHGVATSQSSRREPRKRNSAYYRTLHMLRKKYRSHRQLQRRSISEIVKRLLHLKKQSLNRQLSTPFNPKTLKSLSVSVLNTEYFRRHCLEMSLGRKEAPSAASRSAEGDAAEVGQATTEHLGVKNSPRNSCSNEIESDAERSTPRSDMSTNDDSDDPHDDEDANSDSEKRHRHAAYNDGPISDRASRKVVLSGQHDAETSIKEAGALVQNTTEGVEKEETGKTDSDDNSNQMSTETHVGATASAAHTNDAYDTESESESESESDQSDSDESDSSDSGSSESAANQSDADRTNTDEGVVGKFDANTAEADTSELTDDPRTNAPSSAKCYADNPADADVDADADDEYDVNDSDDGENIAKEFDKDVNKAKAVEAHIFDASDEEKRINPNRDNDDEGVELRQESGEKLHAEDGINSEKCAAHSSSVDSENERDSESCKSSGNDEIYVGITAIGKADEARSTALHEDKASTINDDNSKSREAKLLTSAEHLPDDVFDRQLDEERLAAGRATPQSPTDAVASSELHSNRGSNKICDANEDSTHSSSSSGSFSSASSNSDAASLYTDESTSSSSTATSSQENSDPSELAALERELSSHYEDIKSETIDKTEVDRETLEAQKCLVGTDKLAEKLHDIANLKKVLEGDEEESLECSLVDDVASAKAASSADADDGTKATKASFEEIEKPITRHEVEEMLLAAFESAVKGATEMDELAAGVELTLPNVEVRDKQPLATALGPEMDAAGKASSRAEDFTIPKLSDLCRNALNSSCKPSEPMTFARLETRHHQRRNAGVDDASDGGDGAERAACELSVEEALAEMYRQAGVASEPEDFDADDADEKPAEEVLLINLEEILVSDSDNLYVLQCDMNENILGVLETQTDEPNDTQQQQQQQQQQPHVVVVGNGAADDSIGRRLNTLELVELLNASDDLAPEQTTDDLAAPKSSVENRSSDEASSKSIHRASPTSTSASSRCEVDRLFTEAMSIPLPNTNTNNFSTKLLPPANASDGELYDDDDFDLPTIHHEEIVPDNYKSYHSEKFLKYLHAKYLQRNISNFCRANRVLKKYKKRLVQKLLRSIHDQYQRFSKSKV